MGRPRLENLVLCVYFVWRGLFLSQNWHQQRIYINQIGYSALITDGDYPLLPLMLEGIPRPGFGHVRSLPCESFLTQSNFRILRDGLMFGMVGPMFQILTK